MTFTFYYAQRFAACQLIDFLVCCQGAPGVAFKGGGMLRCTQAWSDISTLSSTQPLLSTGCANDSARVDADSGNQEKNLKKLPCPLGAPAAQN